VRKGTEDRRKCNPAPREDRRFCNVRSAHLRKPAQSITLPVGTPVAIGDGMTNQRQDLNARAFKLAARVFKLFPKLVMAGSGHAYIARQLLRATASVGANLEEGSAASSRRDMVQKYSIALRESREGKYWSRLLATDPAWSSTLEDVIQETSEFAAMLTVSVKKLRLPVGSSQPLKVRGHGRRKSRRLARRRRR